MTNVSAKKQFIVRLPKLATMVFVFWGLSSGAHLDAAPSWQFVTDLPPYLVPGEDASYGDSSIHVLSDLDATLYRAAFIAQEKNDWSIADEALEHVQNRGLIGHVLADRYLRKGLTVEEAKKWFASYSDYPEAPALFDKVKKLKRFQATSIPQPSKPTKWQGSGGVSMPTPVEWDVNSGNDPAAKTRIKKQIKIALRNNDPVKARNTLNAALGKGALSLSDAGDLVGHISASLYYNNDNEGAAKMAQVASENGGLRGQWVKGLVAWKQQDFDAAAHAFSDLAKAPDLSSWNRAAAAYWAYRATSRLGDKAGAYRWLAEAAKAPKTFYGAMAANLMGRSVSGSWAVPELDSKASALLAESSAGWQALALTQVGGHRDLAESELRRALATSKTKKLRTAALALAEKARMPSLALQLSGIAVQGNGQTFEGARYPLPPWQPTGGFTVDRALIYAIMKHESLFNPEAVSVRGARGLMQIMPATAQHIVSNDNRAPCFSKPQCSDQLLNPNVNVDMGQKYVRTLSEQPEIGNNLLFVLAAYNGGPSKLTRWLSENDKSDPLLFIESLPSRETREYVQQVLLHYWMYRSRLAQPQTTLAQLARGEWPKVALNDSGSKRAEVRNFKVADAEPVRKTGTR